ncbi:MAG: glycosyltransferase [bacterium]
MKNPRYSVIIPAYDSENTIADCLESLMAQDLDEPFEILVVNSSSDETPRIIKERFPRVTLLQRERRTDQGKARNLALEQAAGEIIFFLDADCTVEPDWMRRMRDRHEEYGELLGVGGPVLNADLDNSIGWAGYLIEFGHLFPQGELRETWHLGAGNVSYKRSFFDRGFRFPEELRFAQEDIMFNWHLKNQGIRFLFDPRITVVHHHRTDWPSFLRHQYKLARGTVHLLANTEMEGSWLVKHRWLALLLMPLVGGLKFYRTGKLFYRFQPKLFRKSPGILPVIMAGVVSWCLGFGRELYFAERVKAVFQIQ